MRRARLLQKLLIYQLPIAEIHAFFGVNPSEIAKEAALFIAPEKQVAWGEFGTTEGGIMGEENL